MQAQKTYGYHLMAILTVAVWGLTFISTKVLINSGLSPQDIFFYRFLIAYVCIWFISPRKLVANTLKDELYMLAAGLTGGTLYFLAENTALGITLASNVSFIICTAPLLTTLLTLLIYKNEKASRVLILGSLIALLGVALVVYNGNFVLKISPLGDLLTVVAALMWAFYSLILTKLGHRYSTVFITRKIFFYGILTVLPLFIFHPLQPDSSVLLRPAVLFNLLFLGVVASLICFVLWNLTLKNLGVVRTSSYIYLTPLVTLIGSAMLIDEPITWVAMIGSALILGGVYLASRKW